MINFITNKERHWSQDIQPLSSGSRLEGVIEFFSIYLILPAALGLGVYPASNRNKYQMIFLGSRALLAQQANNLTAICEPIV
jgi:hypothetical protein